MNVHPVIGLIAAGLVAACNVVPHRGIIGAHAIFGVVRDADTGAPISGVTVCARYAKLSLRYYVRGFQVTGASGVFRIEKKPERVSLLDGPRGSAPSLTFSHPDYAEHGVLLQKFEGDEELEIHLKRRPAGLGPSKYLTCSDSAVAR